LQIDKVVRTDLPLTYNFVEEFETKKNQQK